MDKRCQWVVRRLVEVCLSRLGIEVEERVNSIRSRRGKHSCHQAKDRQLIAPSMYLGTDLDSLSKSFTDYC